MPIFEYGCRRCNHVFEQIVLSATEPISCPKCNSDAVDKLISIFSAPGSRGEASTGGCGCTPQTCGCH